MSPTSIGDKIGTFINDQMDFAYLIPQFELPSSKNLNDFYVDLTASPGFDPELKSFLDAYLSTLSSSSSGLQFNTGHYFEFGPEVIIIVVIMLLAVLVYEFFDQITAFLGVFFGLIAVIIMVIVNYLLEDSFGWWAVQLLAGSVVFVFAGATIFFVDHEGAKVMAVIELIASFMMLDTSPPVT